MLGSFFSLAWKSARRQWSSVWFWLWATGSRPGAGRLRRWGALPALPGILPFYNYYCSQRACTLEKGAGEAGGKLLSQLSFSVYAGQVVFRSGTTAELRQGSLATQSCFCDVTFFARVMLCVMFSVSSWELFCDRVSPLERQGTQVAAPASPFFVFPTHHGGVRVSSLCCG